MNKTVWMCFAASAALTLSAAVPEDGGVWTIGTGETETLSTGATIAQLLNDGALTLENGAALSVTGAVVNVVGTGTGKSGLITIKGGASLNSTGTLTGTPDNSQGFAIGAIDGTGTVTVEAGGSLTVTGGRFFLGRNGGTDYRELLSSGILNVFGTVSATYTECGAWYPQPAAADYGTYVVGNLPVVGTINLEEGGVFETGHFQLDDLSRTVINFKGGTLRALRQDDSFMGVNASFLWNIAEGKNLIFDTQNFHIRILPSTVQPDFFQITGAGGLVKKGSAYLQICLQPEVNTFTGPILVEEGTLSIGRPLAEGQTVYVMNGAQFYPAAPSDFAKITYANPADEPQGGIYAVQTRLYGGLDLMGMSPKYVTDQLAGPIWGWGAEVHGEITHAADISLDHPFGLVGQQGYQLGFYETGLQDLPLALSGRGIFVFNGNRTNTVDNTITFTGTTTYEQNGSFNVLGENGETPVMTVSGPGTFKTGNLRVGLEGGDGKLVLKDGVSVTVNGSLRIGSNAGGDTRQTVRGLVEMENATLTTSADVNFAPNALVDGSDLTTVLNELVLGPGSDLRVGSRITRNDDARSRITFAGGMISPLKNYAEFFYTGQNGTFEIEATEGYDARLNIGPYSVGMFDNHTHLFGDGGLAIIGSSSNPIGVFTLGKPGLSDFEVSYKGDTTITDATLKLGVPLPEGSIVSGTRATLDIGGFTVDSPVGDVKVKGPGTVVVGRDNADVAFSQQIEGAQLLKVGTGTLTLDSALNGGALTVREGSVTVKGTAYSSYRFKVEDIKGPYDANGVNSMQLAELILLCGTTDVTRPYKAVSFDSTSDTNGTTYPANEAPGNLVDGNIGTKWLDFRAHPSRSATDRDRVWLRIDYEEPKIITGYTWITANDTPGRDPAGWRLQGSNDDGATWTDLDVRSGFVVTALRFTTADFFPAGGSFGPDSLVTVEPGATLLVDGGIVPVSALENHGTVELLNGATLTSVGGYLNGAVTGSGSVEVTGGTVTLVGEPAYTGDTHVSGGVLNVGVGSEPPVTRGFDGRFFRLTIRRSNGGNGYENGVYNIQASEFQLYNEAGVMQNKGLIMRGVGLAATALITNSFTCATEFATPTATEGVEKLFDGDLETKWYCSDPINGAVPNYHVITMRLADEAELPITSYNFFTANDHVRRSPSEWKLEGSRDGVIWEVLDERYWAPHTPYDVKGNYSAESVQRKPFNNGVNYTFEPLERPVSFPGKFLRFTFKKTVGDTMLQFSELMLFNALGENEAFGLTMAADATPAASLQPGTFSRGGNYSVGKVTQDMDMLFDNEPNTKLCANNNDMNGDASRYRIVTMRLADEALPVNGYLLVTANDNLNRSPCDWLVEGSMDGETWVTLDERAGVPQPYCLYTAMNAGHPFTFDSYVTGASLPADSSVQVDTGAVLNLNSAGAAISALRVDCMLGGGTINAFRPAAHGTIDLVNLPPGLSSLVGYTIPLTVNGLSDGETLSGWELTVDGVNRGGFQILVEDNHLVLMNGGTVLLLR